MKILITGGAGFIGSNLANFLIKKNHKVTIIDNFSTGFTEHTKSNNNFKIINCDLLKLEKLKKFFKGHEFIFHLAANADIRFGLNNPKKDLEQNAICTFNVLEAMRVNRIKKIAFTSTAPIYGNTNNFPTKEYNNLAHQTSLYGASKLYCESLIQCYCEGFDFQSWIFRFVSILGPGYSHGHVFDFYKKIKKNKNKLEILGNGKQKKSYLHVLDCIDAMYLAINKANKKINIFNLGDKNFITVNHSAKLICKYFNIRPKFCYSGGDRGWIGDQPKVHLDTSKIKKLGWSNKFSIDESIIDTIRWLENNEWILFKRK